MQITVYKKERWVPPSSDSNALSFIDKVLSESINVREGIVPHHINTFKEQQHIVKVQAMDEFIERLNIYDSSSRPSVDEFLARLEHIPKAEQPRLRRYRYGNEILRGPGFELSSLAAPIPNYMKRQRNSPTSRSSKRECSLQQSETRPGSQPELCHVKAQVFGPLKYWKKSFKSHINNPGCSLHRSKVRPSSRPSRYVSTAPVRVQFPGTEDTPPYEELFATKDKAIAAVFEKSQGRFDDRFSFDKESRTYHVTLHGEPRAQEREK
jgi:hypothetical protein